MTEIEYSMEEKMLQDLFKVIPNSCKNSLFENDIECEMLQNIFSTANNNNNNNFQKQECIPLQR